MAKKYLMELIENENIPQSRIEKKIGVKLGTLSRLLHTNNKRIRIHTMQKIADYFGLPIGEIADFEASYEFYKEMKFLKENKTGRIKEKDLKKEIKEMKKEKENLTQNFAPKQCLNQRCLLNNNKFCESPVVLSGRAGCKGQYKVTEPIEEVSWEKRRHIVLMRYNREVNNYEKCI